VPELSIADNISSAGSRGPGWGHGEPAGDGRRVPEIAGELGLRLDRARLVRTCQIAEQQLIEVAKALSLNVTVLIMDEPTSALGRRRGATAVRGDPRLVARGVAVIYISHRWRSVEIADRVTSCGDGGYIGTRRWPAPTRPS